MIYNNLQTPSAVFIFPWYLSNKFLYGVWEETSDYLIEQQQGDSEGCIWLLPLCTFVIPISTAGTMLQTLGLGSSFLKPLFLWQFCKNLLILQFASPIGLTVEAKLTRFRDTNILLYSVRVVSESMASTIFFIPFHLTLPIYLSFMCCPSLLDSCSDTVLGTFFNWKEALHAYRLSSYFKFTARKSQY